MEVIYAVWTVVLVLHLPMLALPFMYSACSDRDPIRCQGPAMLLYQNVLTVLFIFEQILRCLLSRVLPVAVEVLLGQSLLALMVVNMLFYVVRLYVAFSKTAEQTAAHDTITSMTSSQLLAIKRRIHLLKLLVDPKTARMYTAGHLFLQIFLQVLYLIRNPGLAWTTLHEAETARADDFNTFLNIAIVLDLIPLIAFIVLAWKLRVVVDAFGIKSMLRKTGWSSLFGFIVYLLTKAPLNAISDLYIPYMISVLNLDVFMYLAFVQPMARARRSRPFGKTIDGTVSADAVRVTDEFVEFLRTPPCFAEFNKHLEKEFCIESLLFWADVEAFRVMARADMAAASEAIFDKYLRVDAPFEVNLSSKWLREFRDVLFVDGKVDVERTLSATMFDGAANQMLTLMRVNSLQRFKDAHPAIWSDFQYARRERNVLDKLNSHVTTNNKRTSSISTAVTAAGIHVNQTLA